MEILLPFRYSFTQIPTTNCPSASGIPDKIPVAGSMLKAGSPPIGSSGPYGGASNVTLSYGGGASGFGLVPSKSAAFPGVCQPAVPPPFSGLHNSYTNKSPSTSVAEWSKVNCSLTQITIGGNSLKVGVLFHKACASGLIST